MDISRILELGSTSGSRTNSPIDIFRQLTQLGSIEARVAAISRGQALLLTQLGQIPTSNTLNLKSGDVIQIRASGNEQNPVLKVSAEADKPVILDPIRYPALNKLLTTGKPISATFINHQTNGAGIKIGNRVFSITQPPDLKPGQLISLVKSSNNNHIEVKAIDHRQVLKSSINRLLPHQPITPEHSGLTQLIKLVQSLPKSISVATGTNQLTSHLNNNAMSTIKPAIAHTQSGNEQQQKPAPANNLLQNLLNSVPTASRLDKTTLEQWVGRLLTKLPMRETNSQSGTYQLLQQFPKNEASLVQMLQKITQQAPDQQKSSSSANVVEAKPIQETSLQLIARDIIKMAEQSNNQQLLQQTSLRYQQELQQPLVINLAIPVSDEQKTKELRLKIRQKHHGNDVENQCWDIHFNFEFGLLGLISTHLILDIDTLSASFWSELPDTQNKIETGLDEFKQQLNRAGFKLGQFYSFIGNPPLEDEETMVPSSESLLDIKV